MPDEIREKLAALENQVEQLAKLQQEVSELRAEINRLSSQDEVEINGWKFLQSGDPEQAGPLQFRKAAVIHSDAKDENNQDVGSLSLVSGGSIADAQGSGLHLYANEHPKNPTQVFLFAGVPDNKPEGRINLNQLTQTRKGLVVNSQYDAAAEESGYHASQVPFPAKVSPDDPPLAPRPDFMSTVTQCVVKIRK